MYSYKICVGYRYKGIELQNLMYSVGNIDNTKPAN